MKNLCLFFKQIAPVFVFVFVVFVGADTTLAQADKMDKMEMKDKSLYVRLGGYDALAAVSDDFIIRLATSKRLGRFVAGLSDDSKKRLRQHLVEFLCNATGGSCLYLGRDMKTVHTGLGIDEADWNESTKLLTQTLDKFKVPSKEKNEVLTAVSSLKPDIVEKK